MKLICHGIPPALATLPRPIRCVLDTDTYNEIDDQFALVYALLAPECLKVEAIYAAPFFCPGMNDRSTSPADGMEKSYEEILRVLGHLDFPFEDGYVRQGSRQFLPNGEHPVESEAARDLVERARMLPPGESLCVLAIAALTNIASALLIAPDIAEKLVVVWLGGHPYDWHDGAEFNLRQDVAAVQVVFESGVPLVHIPCKNVAEYLRSSVPEMTAFLKGQGAIGDYLDSIFCAYYGAEQLGWSKPVWDIATVAAVVAPEAFTFVTMSRPRLTDSMIWKADPTGAPVTVAIDLNRDIVFRDLFERFRSNATSTVTSTLSR